MKDERWDGPKDGSQRRGWEELSRQVQSQDTCPRRNAVPRQYMTWNESGFLLPLPDSKAIQIHLCIANDIGKSLLKGGRKLSFISPFTLTLCLSWGQEDLKPLLGTF